MSNIRVKLSRLTSKKVPVLSLVVVALAGMVLGVMAASLTINQNNFLGTTGTYTANTGTMTVTDQGLSIISNVPSSANTSATFGPNTTNRNIFYSATTNFVAGQWEESVQLTDTASDANPHTVKITIDSGPTAPAGTALVAQATVTLTGPGSASTGTITVYVALQTASITAPMTVYVTST